MVVATKTAPLSDLDLYCNCMDEVRHRIAVIDSVMTGSVTTGHRAFDTELVFVQFRKILELIAFASLTANKAEYSAAYEKFATHWNAQWMLRDLEKVNADFYPISLEPYELKEDGIKHFPRTAEGFLTKEDFVTLYDRCGKVLHARNPFSTEGLPIPIGYSVAKWVSRIQKLLGQHSMHLVNGDKLVVVIPAEGKIHACSATPVAIT